MKRKFGPKAFVILWLLCGVAAYPLARGARRNATHRWTQQDRLFCILLVPTGPLALASAGLAYLHTAPSMKEPANW